MPLTKSTGAANTQKAGNYKRTLPIAVASHNADPCCVEDNPTRALLIQGLNTQMSAVEACIFLVRKIGMDKDSNAP